MIKMGINEIYKKILQKYKEDKPLVATKKLFYAFTTRERMKRYGEKNPNATIYIIRGYNYKSPFCVAPVHNLLANYFYVISHLFYAKEKGWIPIVDQQNFPEYNSMDYPINGTMNAWEYFWEQPNNFSLDEAYHSKNVILSRRNFLTKWDLGYKSIDYYDKALVQKYYEMSKLIPLNKYTNTYIEKAKCRFLPANKKILGVNVRLGGHSMHSITYRDGHPVQPEIEDLISIIKRRKKEWNQDFIFLASDNEATINEFKNTFDEEVIVYNRMRAEIGKEYMKDTDKEMYNKCNLFQTTLDYLTEMELLASCDALVGSITSGFRYAVVHGVNRYNHLEVIDRGRFPE